MIHAPTNMICFLIIFFSNQNSHTIYKHKFFYSLFLKTGLSFIIVFQQANKVNQASHAGLWNAAATATGNCCSAHPLILPFIFLIAKDESDNISNTIDAHFGLLNMTLLFANNINTLYSKHGYTNHL